MKFLRLYIGSTKKWMTGFLLFGLAGIFSPTAWQGWWHIKHPNTVVCNTYSVRIPFYWTGSNENADASTICKDGIYLVKFGATIFGSSDNGSSLDVFPESATDRSKNAAHAEQVFRQSHGGASAVPYQLNSTIQDCISMKEQSGRRQIVNVSCADHERGIIVHFSGSEHALTEASKLIW
jgi:hypothetical protein